MRIDSRALAAALLAAGLSSTTAWAAPGHGKSYSFGEPGTASAATRSVEVSVEDRDGMRFVMDTGPIEQGETIEFVVTNNGSGEHEFSVGDTASQRAHARLMAKNPDMKHAGDPSAVHLQPGETKTVVWKFSKAVASGGIVFACQMPGHYEGGMVHEAKFTKAKKGSPAA